MIEINWSDVFNVLNQIRPYLIALGVVIAAAIIASVACKGMERPKKYLVRTQSLVTAALALVVVVSLICTGPMSTVLTLATTPVREISAESASNAETLGQKIAEEGIVLLQNEENVLPLSGNALNVFGWASAYPVYGGTGSGALSDAYHIVDLLEGLSYAGIETNTELSDFYRAYREGRPAVGMWEQDWTLPEPPADTYSQEMI